MYDFKNMNKISDNLKKLLEKDFYLMVIDNKIINNNIDNKEYLRLLDIKKENKSIFEDITSFDKLEDIKKLLLLNYEDLINDFMDYFDRVENGLDEHNKKSFEIIEKTLKNRYKKLNSIIERFQIENSWSVKNIKEEFFNIINPILEDIISSIIKASISGLKLSNIYKEIIKILNRFLIKLGIYTRCFDINQKLTDDDFNFLLPQDCDNCDTDDKSKKDRIKDVLTLPYLIGKDNIVLNGEVIIWRMRHNG